MAIVCKSAAEIEKMRRSGGIVREVLNHVRTLVVPGATTMDLERAAEHKIKDLGVKRMRVLSDPKQMHGISAFGLEIEGYVGAEG